MPGQQGLKGFFGRLFGRGTPSPAEQPAQRGEVDPEAAIRQHFVAIQAHDLDGILDTLAPERARLYNNPRTLDKRRLTVMEVHILHLEPADDSVPLPSFAQRYPAIQVWRVTYELKLVEPEKRRDPTLQDGEQWAYFILVSEGNGRPWLIADWGR